MRRIEVSGNNGRQPFEVMETYLIGFTRLALSAWALIAVCIDPIEAESFLTVGYILLVLYVCYSLSIFVLNFFRPVSVPFQVLHWTDVLWYVLLIGFSAGTSSIFYFFFFFAILIASFRFGFTEGLRVTAVSAFSFTVIGYLTAPQDDIFELNGFILRPGYLIIIGYLMAYWGGKEILSKRRLKFLRALGQMSNPRFGIDQTISSMLKQMQAFYEAEVCLALIRGLNSSAFSIIKIAGDQEQSVPLTAVPKDAVSPLLEVPPRIMFSVNTKQGFLHKLSLKKKYYALDLKRNCETDRYQDAAEGIANFLDVSSLISLPIFFKETNVGRLFIGADHYKFMQSDVEFMLQASEQVVPVLENVQILNQLASSSAERERVKISRDLHDSTVQPYLGLKFKLEGILRKLSPNELLYDEVNELVDMVTKSVSDLRGYISNLKDESDKQSEPLLIEAIRRKAEQFTRYHSIKVDFEAPEKLQIPDRLAAEVFQMVSEGLSNINRHTRSDYAAIKLLIENESLTLMIENDNVGNGSKPNAFYPKSLAGRAVALGGNLTIKQNGKTSVVIKVPI